MSGALYRPIEPLAILLLSGRCAINNILLILALAAFIASRYGRSRKRRVQTIMPRDGGAPVELRVGPAPGYARFTTPEALSAFHRIGTNGDTKVLSVELFMLRNRMRWVVRLVGTFASEDAARRHFTALARSLAYGAKAHVVAVEWFKDHKTPHSHPDGILVYAQDGRGWEGADEGVYVIGHFGAGPTYVLNALTGSPARPGDGWHAPPLV